MSKVTVSVAGETATVEYSVSPDDPIRAAAYPRAYTTVAELVAGEGLPPGAKYVMWRPEWDGKMLEEVHILMADDEAVLVLPERAAPYEVDSSAGFMAAGVSAISGTGGKWIPVAGTYKGKTARTWFAMTRARRGIVGMGPGVVIRPSASSFTREAQVPDDGDGLRYKNLAGAVVRELVGCQDKVIESNHPRAIFANFRMEGRDFGGVAFHGITAKGGLFARRLWLDAPHRGFSAVPNGEAGALAINGGVGYDLAGLWLGCVDSIGRRVGSSPIMINSSAGGWLRDVWAFQAVAGMPTWWNCIGVHEVTNLHSRWNAGNGINLEKCLNGFDIRFNGGSIWPNRDGKGGHPSPDGVNGKLHIGCNIDAGTVRVTVSDVDYDTGPTAGALCVQQYGSTIPPVVAAVTSGTSKPVKVYA